MKQFLVFLVVIFCAHAYSSGQPPTGVTQVPPTEGDTTERYRIGYQDTLEVSVFRHSDLNRRVTVNPDGTINLFRLERPIVAVCKTATELADDIAKAYEKDYLRNPEVSVFVIEQRSQSVAVIGAVQKAGQFYITRRMQLIEMIAAAGGPDMEKVGSRVSVFRPGSTANCKSKETPATTDADIQLMNFNLKDVQEGRQTLWLKPGDVVSVSRADQVFVYGNVNKQGAVEMREPLTLTRAIVLAEGLKPAAEMDRIRVVRQKPGSAESVEFLYNFKEIVKGKAPDPFLEPNDIVAISQDKAQNIINTIGRSLTGGIPSIFYRIP